MILRTILSVGVSCLSFNRDNTGFQMTLPRVGALLLSVGGAGFLLGSQLRFGRQQVEKEWPWVALGLVLGIFVKVHMSQPYTGQRILSPRLSVLPGLKADEIASLSYPPGAFPGSRDVDSPYGSLRVYEWGPLDGTRILLIHGISTPCLSLGTRYLCVPTVAD